MYTLPSLSEAIAAGHISWPAARPPVPNSPKYSCSTVHIVTRLYPIRTSTSGPTRFRTYITPSRPMATSTGLLNPLPISA